MSFSQNKMCVETTDRPLRLFFYANRNARQSAAKTAWLDHEQAESMTHAELFHQTKTARERLRAEGVSEGDVICFLLTRSGGFLPVLLACIELGAILAPVKPDPHEFKSDVRALRPRLILRANDSLSFAIEEIKKTRLLSIREIFANPITPQMQEQPDEAGGHDLREKPCLLIKTSGTTGQPKYVELSEKNLAWDAFYLQTRYACQPHDRLLCTLPWNHMNAIMMTGCLPLLAGATTEYRNITKSQDPIQNIIDSRATIASLTPTLISFLLKKQKPFQTLKTLRFVFCGAAPLNRVLWQKAEEALQCPIYQGYGLTETTCWAAATPPGSAHNHDQTGTPLGGEVAINSESVFQIVTETDAAANASQKIGEIQVRGPIVMCGYRYPDGRRKSGLNPDGFFDTGDIGYFDENQCLRIVGRKKEIIIRSGINIVPESIDAIVRMHPAILECKTVGLPDELLGERAVTACVPKPGSIPSKMDVRRFAAEKISGQYLPDDFVFMAELPKTEVGKIAFGELRKIVGGDYAQQAFDAINTWKFKRAHPAEPKRIVQTFQQCILGSRPVTFVSYWGAGLKSTVSDTDREALERLNEFIHTAGIPRRLTVSLELILTDTHALLNGKPEQRVDLYFSEISRLCRTYGYHCVRLSDLWTQAGMSLDVIAERAEKKALMEIIEMLALPEKLVTRLVNSAKKHVEQDDPEKGLKRYLLACQTEREAIAKKYEGAVFLTYNDPSMAFLTPPLPTIALSSFRRGTGEKPWFVEA